MSKVKQNTITTEKLINEAETFLNQRRTNQEIFEHIIKNAPEIDYQKISKDYDIESDKIKRKDFIVIVIDDVLEAVRNLDFGLCFHHDSCYVYNGCFWSKSNETELKNFLGDFSVTYGLSNLSSRYFRFKEDLFKQFASTASNIKFLQKEKTKILLNLRNGTLEVENGSFKLREFRKEDFLTYQLKFDYDVEASCPKFDDFLDEVLPDQNLQMIISEYFGTIFIPDEMTKVEKALFLFGDGQNGKSVIYEVIEALFGKENLSSYSLNKLTSSENARYNIKDKIINFSSEIGEITNVDTFKKLVSREPIDARCLYQDLLTIRDYAKLAFNCNKLPKHTELSKGFFRRFLIIPFDVIIKDEETDKNLSQKIIKNELSGVLNWIIGGLKRYLEQDDFTNSERCQEVQSEFEKESDNVALFIDEENKEKAENDFVLVSETYSQYKTYCIENGFKPCSRRTFVKRLTRLGFQKVRKAQGYMFNIKTK